MSRKPITIIMLSSLLLIGAVAFSFWKTGTKNQSAEAAAVSTNGLTLDLRFGNNNGAAAPTVYDSSGYNRHATSTAGATSPTCNGQFCDFDGGDDVVSTDSTNIFNSSNISIAIKFSPDRSPTSAVYESFFTGWTSGSRTFYAYKHSNGGFSLAIGAADISIPAVNYQPLWRVGKENILIWTLTSGNNNAWFNGVKVLSGDVNAQVTQNPTNFEIGKYGVGVVNFAGKLHYLKIWNRLLTDAEVGILSADRTAKTASAPMASSTPASSGRLVGHWTMDNNDISGTTVYDKSGLNNNGTMTGTTNISGKMREARSFNGSSDFIQCATGKNYSSTESHTYSAWIKISTYPSIYYWIIGNDGTNVGTSLAINQTGRIALFGEGGVQVVLSSATPVIPFNTWTNILVAYDSSTAKANFYLNGNFINQSGALTAFNGGTTACRIGRWQGVADYYMAGSIDDVRIYNYALSAQEVSQLYSSAKKNHTSAAPMDGLVGHWTMDANDKNGTTWLDKSGFGLNATSTGSPTIVAGKINQAVIFNSTNYLDAGIASALNFGTRPFSIGFWLNPANTASSDIISKWGDSVLNGPGFTITRINNQVLGFVGDNNGYLYCANDSAPLNQWTHVIFVKSGTSFTCYVNGSFSSNTGGTFPADIGSPNVNLFIGKKQHYINNYSGKLDDVRIYNRALTAQEISQLYNSAKKAYIR